MPEAAWRNQPAVLALWVDAVTLAAASVWPVVTWVRTGLVVTIAASITTQASTLAPNKPRRSRVSAFMVVPLKQVQMDARTQIMSSTIGSTQLDGAETSREAIDAESAKRIDADLLVTMAARIRPQTSMHATNNPRRITVSNFMSVTPAYPMKVLALSSAIPVPGLLAMPMP
jgi:hypothetical protein